MIEKAIKVLLTQTLGINVAPLIAEGKALRAKFSEVSTVHGLNIDVTVNTAKSKRIQVDIWGPTFAGVKQTEKLAESLNGYSGTVSDTKISLIKIDGQKPDWEPKENQYRSTVDLIFYYDD